MRRKILLNKKEIDKVANFKAQFKDGSIESRFVIVDDGGSGEATQATDFGDSNIPSGVQVQGAGVSSSSSGGSYEVPFNAKNAYDRDIIPKANFVPYKIKVDTSFINKTWPSDTYKFTVKAFMFDTAVLDGDTMYPPKAYYNKAVGSREGCLITDSSSLDFYTNTYYNENNVEVEDHTAEVEKISSLEDIKYTMPVSAGRKFNFFQLCYLYTTNGYIEGREESSYYINIDKSLGYPLLAAEWTSQDEYSVIHAVPILEVSLNYSGYPNYKNETIKLLVTCDIPIEDFYKKYKEDENYLLKPLFNIYIAPEITSESVYAVPMLHFNSETKEVLSLNEEVYNVYQKYYGD